MSLVPRVVATVTQTLASGVHRWAPPSRPWSRVTTTHHRLESLRCVRVATTYAGSCQVEWTDAMWC